MNKQGFINPGSALKDIITDSHNSHTKTDREVDIRNRFDLSVVRTLCIWADPTAIPLNSQSPRLDLNDLSEVRSLSCRGTSSLILVFTLAQIPQTAFDRTA